MMRAALLVIGFVAIAVTAYMMGTQLALATAAPPAAPPAAPRVVERVSVPAAPRLAIVRAEPEPIAAPDRPVRSATAAIAIVEAGIRDGTWSAAERDSLRVELADLEAAEIDAVLTPLFQAINAQRVRLDGPPI